MCILLVRLTARYVSRTIACAYNTYYRFDDVANLLWKNAKKQRSSTSRDQYRTLRKHLQGALYSSRMSLSEAAYAEKASILSIVLIPNLKIDEKLMVRIFFISSFLFVYLFGVCVCVCVRACVCVCVCVCVCLFNFLSWGWKHSAFVSRFFFFFVTFWHRFATPPTRLNCRSKCVTAIQWGYVYSGSVCTTELPGR